MTAILQKPHAVTNAEAQLKTIRDLKALYEYIENIEDLNFANEETQLEAFKVLYGHLDCVREWFEQHDDMIDCERVQVAIDETPLALQVRDDWRSPWEEETNPVEFLILLSTGGPACRIIGQLNSYGEAFDAEIQHQDWGTGWERLRLNDDDEEALNWFANRFYWGE